MNKKRSYSSTQHSKDVRAAVTKIGIELHNRGMTQKEFDESVMAAGISLKPGTRRKIAQRINTTGQAYVTERRGGSGAALTYEQRKNVVGWAYHVIMSRGKYGSVTQQATVISHL